MNVALLWHMHQPHYVDTIGGAALMPWVRLHATKGYLDMIWLVEQYPELHCTFNLTPVLLRQIEQLANREIADRWFDLAATPASDLTPQQQCALLEHYFKANWDNMIKPYPRYWSLLQQRGARCERGTLPTVATRFSEQDFRDLQVWFHLTWFGFAAQKLYPEIVALKQKGCDFTEEDKQIVFRCQQNILQTLIGRYKSAADTGQIEISTSPFYHPILPLLFDNRLARRAMPGCRLPPPFEHPEDARAQLRLAQEQHTRLFGAPARGLWPPEGSVCPEMIPMLTELGFEWFATDEEILWRSLPNQHTSDRELLYQGFWVEQGASAMKVAFRDRALSDFIGFSASRNPPRYAADLLVTQMEAIARKQTSQASDSLCAIILDGENAWEHFPDGGETFLRSFYERLHSHPSLRTVTFQEYFRAHSPRTTVSNLYTGSWINADFHIWIGDSEDNRAWQLLGETRAFLQTRKVEPSIERKAMEEIYAAEGSDWFWWYGDQFATDNDLLFDELFRIHLQNVYHLLNAPVPLALKTHICSSASPQTIRQPTNSITPIIDGRITSSYEWSGAGVYEAIQAYTSMFSSRNVLRAIYFAVDREMLYLRGDLSDPTTWPMGLVLRFHFARDPELILDVSGFETKKCHVRLTDAKPEQPAPRAVFDQVLELQVPLQLLRCNSMTQFSFFVEVLAQGTVWERHPEVGSISIE